MGLTEVPERFKSIIKAENPILEYLNPKKNSLKGKIIEFFITK